MKSRVRIRGAGDPTVLIIIIVVVIIVVAVGATLAYLNEDADNSTAVPSEDGEPICHSKCAWFQKTDCATDQPMGLCLGIWGCDDPVSGVRECLR